MSTSNSNYSGGILTTNYDTSKIFIFNNSFADGEVNNSDYDDLVLPAGTLMGRISSDGTLVPLRSAANNGSQYPVGILAGNYIVADGETVNVRICTAGEVDASMVKLQGSDTLDTVISGRRIRDRIAGDTVGIILRTVDQLSDFDNQ